jgi:hypothetical protein
MDELYKHALTALQNWTAGWRRALERLKKLAQQASAPPWWETNAGDLVAEAYRAGLRDWICHALGVDALVDGPDDLRLWCRLQAKALKICRDAYPVHFCYSQRDLYDKDLLREAMPLLVEPKAHAGDPLKQFAWLESFECIDKSFLPLYWDTQRNREEEVDAVPIPDRPRQGDYQELIRRAWGYVRSVASFAGQPPPEDPGQVQDETAFQSALHLILIWCGKLEKSQSSGGAGALQATSPEKDPQAGREDDQSRSGPVLSQPTPAGEVGEGNEAAASIQGIYEENRKVHMAIEAWEAGEQQPPSHQAQQPPGRSSASTASPPPGTAPIALPEPCRELANTTQATPPEGDGAEHGPPTSTPAALEGSPPSEAAYQFRQIGTIWHVRFGEGVGTFPDSKGFRHMARLLGSPNQPIEALELVGKTGTPSGGVIQATSALPDALVEIPLTRETAQPGLDEEARQSYKRRLEDIKDEINEAREEGDEERAERLQSEFQRVLAELQSSTGLGGKIRPLGPSYPAEKARQAVRKALDRALKTLANATPPLIELVEHLGATIKAEGTAFAYYPKPPAPDWEL